MEHSQMFLFALHCNHHHQAYMGTHTPMQMCDRTIFDVSKSFELVMIKRSNQQQMVRGGVECKMVTHRHTSE